MNKFSKDQLKMESQKGITLIALVVTIVVLLILAGITIQLVLADGGIFGQAQKAKEQTEIAKAREKLELVLADAQIMKYGSEGLTDAQLTQKINEVGEELEDKSQVMVDGYIFDIDRSVPKIVDYVGPADGVVITAKVSGNDGWVSADNAKITITGTIKTYSGGDITRVTAYKGETQIVEFAINPVDGRYSIDVTEDTTVTINAEDSKGKQKSKTIPIQIKIDNIPPTLETVNETSVGMKIKFSATGIDNQSGIKHFSYEIISTNDVALEGIPEDKRKGTFIQGETIEITATKEATYTIKVTAVDNGNNLSEVKTAEVTTINGITIAQAKELINENTLRDYIGIRILDYNPSAGGEWRVFYYDKDNEFKFGQNKLFIIRKGVTWGTHLSWQNPEITEKGKSMIQNLNPVWSSLPSLDFTTQSVKRAAKWVDPDNWTDYLTDQADFAMLTPSMELCCASFNKSQEWRENPPKLIPYVSENGTYGIKCEGAWISDPGYTNCKEYGNPFFVSDMLVLSTPSERYDDYYWYVGGGRFDNNKGDYNHVFWPIAVIK